MRKLILSIFFILPLLASAQIVTHGRKAIAINNNAEQTLNSLFDYTIYAKYSLNGSAQPVSTGDFIASMPASKGSISVVASLLTTPNTEIGKYVPSCGGYLNLDNEPNFYWSNISNLTTTFPCEIDFTGVRLFNEPNEAYLNLFGVYLSDLTGNNLRTTNNNADTTSRYAGAQLPIGKPFQVRLIYNADRTVNVWVDGASLGNNRTSFFTGGSNHVTNIGFGTNTNNAKWYMSSVMFINRALTTLEYTTKVYPSLKSLYGTEVTLPRPVYQNVGISQTGNNVNATGTYFSPTGVAEDVSKRVYKWYGAGNNPSAPDVTNNHELVPLRGLSTYNKVTFASLVAADSQQRVDIYCTDINGLYFEGASGVQYYNVQ